LPMISRRRGSRHFSRVSATPQVVCPWGVAFLWREG
jgi:hypothetical protein